LRRDMTAEDNCYISKQNVEQALKVMAGQNFSKFIDSYNQSHSVSVSHEFEALNNFLTAQSQQESTTRTVEVVAVNSAKPLVPCCPRCFCISTHVLNSQRVQQQ
jgi:hypothetical protein